MASHSNDQGSRPALVQHPPDGTPQANTSDASGSKKSKNFGGSASTNPAMDPPPLIDRRKKLPFRDTLMSDIPQLASSQEEEEDFQL